MSNLRAEFYKENDQDFVEITIIGDGTSIVRKVREADKQQFSREWETYSGKKKKRPEGTPLTDLHGIGEKRAKELEAKDIRSIEELSSLSDSAAQVIGMGALELRNSAIKHLQDAREERISEVIGIDAT